MSTLLLDTDVFSYLFKDHPFAEVYRPLLKGHVLAISFMTVAELFQGAFRAGWGGKRIERLARGPVARKLRRVVPLPVRFAPKERARNWQFVCQP